MFLRFHVLAKAALLWYLWGTYSVDAALSSSALQVLNCSTSGNYSTTDTYAANVNHFLATLPENAVSKNGGFFNGTVGLGPNTVYGLAMCPADYSRADCGDCLAAAAASNAYGLPNLCPGSRTVLAMFDRCLVRYSENSFFGTPEIGAVYASAGERVSGSTKVYTDKVKYSLSEATSAASISPQRFGQSRGVPCVFVQCTWDLPADKCKQCLEVLSANATDFWVLRTEGQQKSYSCTVRYSNTTFMLAPFTAGSGPQSVEQKGKSTPSSSSGVRIVTVVGPIIAIVVVACLVASLLYAQKRRRNQHILRETEDIEQVITNTGVIVHDGRFSYKQLESATCKFAEDERLGKGAFGEVYKGKLLVEGKRMNVAVKKIMDTTSEQSKKDFANEFTIMKRVNHRNIVSLLGLCDEIDNLFLVYELLENGNLEDQLYPGENTMDLHAFSPASTPLLLDWHKRKNILVGIASGLVYLHSECKERLLHRDIKPSNVMLDRNFNAKLCDFGLVKQFSHNQTSDSTDNIRGTKTYIDPAYKDTERACEQNDVYSFGIVLLEVVCCQRPALNPDNGKNNLVEKVRNCYYQKKAILQAADNRLRGQFDDELQRVLMIGLMCVQPDHHLRPHIRRVLECLTSKTVDLPYLPPTNHTLPTVNESGSAASTSHNRNSSEDEYSSSFSMLPAHSRKDEDSGTAAFLTIR